eukprot:1606335-Rhodomonas_salina.3
MVLHACYGTSATELAYMVLRDRYGKCGTELAYDPKSSTRNRIFSTSCTRMRCTTSSRSPRPSTSYNPPICSCALAMRCPLWPYALAFLSLYCVWSYAASDEFAMILRYDPTRPLRNVQYLTAYGGGSGEALAGQGRGGGGGGGRRERQEAREKGGGRRR